MKLLLLCFIHAFIANFNVSNGLDVVALQTGFDNYGVVAAFGDYNADKLVDVFVISPSGMHRADLTTSVLGTLVLTFERAYKFIKFASLNKSQLLDSQK